jgi:hypothetical protein
MMMNQKIKIEDTLIEISIDNNIYYDDGICKILGYPVADNLKEITTSNINDKVHEIDGYFLIIISSDNEFMLANDITGGFRLYYLKSPTGFYFTDNYQKALDKAFEIGPLEPNHFEIDFWKRNDYTTGDGTFFHEVKKMPPGAILTFNRRDIEVKHYFKSVENKPDYTKYLDAIHSNLSRTVSTLKERGEKVVLLFSGGYDSTLLALELIAQGVDFIPVYFQLKPSFIEALKDTIRCKMVSNKLGLNTQYFDVEWQVEFKNYSEVINNLLINRHIGAGHFATAEYIRRIYGENVTIVCGQGADSIFSYGPTYNNLNDSLIRSMYYLEGALFSTAINIALRISQFLKKRKGKFYKFYSANSNMYLLSFFDGAGYIPIFNIQRHNYSKDYFLRVIHEITSNLKDRNAKMMALKTYGFLQGSANQVIYSSLRYRGINKVVLPYCTSDIIYSTIKYRNNKHDILNPKYVVMDLIKKHFDFDYPDNVKVGKYVEDNNLVPVSNIQEVSNRKYEERLHQLLEKYTLHHTTSNSN